MGTVLLVSRDRARLNDVATGTLVIDDDGLVKEQQASHDGDLRQRPAEPACQSGPDPDDPGKKAADVSREQSRKLSGNERLEPDSMPGRIEQLEKSWGSARCAGRTVVPPSRRGCRWCRVARADGDSQVAAWGVDLPSGRLWGACIGCVQPINKV